MKIEENQYKSINIYGNLWKSMNINKMYGIYLFWKKKKGYILCSRNMNASHTCPLKKNILFQQRNENHDFLENIDCDL